jgi:signal transduction histidine kinase
MTALPESFNTRSAAAGKAAARARPARGLSFLQTRSIRLRLSGAFVLFLLLALTLGLFSIVELKNVNQVSADIRDRWLQSTRTLGDLNNFTSDYRAAEASTLLSSTPARLARTDRELTELDVNVRKAQFEYERIAHDAAEQRLYGNFVAAWDSYKAVAGQVIGLAHAGRHDAGAALYMTQSRRAYDAASDELGVLTSLTVANAHDASNRAAATYRTARALILLVIALAGLILVGAVNYITRAISNPLLELAARMRSLASNDTQIEIEGADRRDEIGEMARAVVVFRNNAVELALSQRGLVQQAAMLEERLEAERQLTALQRNFVSMASHEFRTPLTIIDGHAQRIINLKDRARPADVAERAGSIRRAVQRMTQIMDGLLNSARLFDGEARLYFHPAEFEPGAMLREVLRTHRESTPAAQIIEGLARAPKTIVGDRALLFQAFSNLVANAVKYSPDGGRILVEADSEPGRLVVRVIDQGLGIPEPDLERIFDRYHRGANVTGVAGTGVGLYLVKTVVSQHGGDIEVASREGQGSCFTVRLPVAQAA